MYNQDSQSMFSRFARLLRSAPLKPLLACTLLTTAYTFNKIRLDDSSPAEHAQPHLGRAHSPDKMLKRIVETEVCSSKAIQEGDLYFFKVKSENSPGEAGKDVEIVIVRFEGKLYAVAGLCSYREPFEDDTHKTFEEAMVFNNKMYCPHHGCAFDVTTGEVEYGPAYNNLSRFYVEEKDGKVILYHPARVPTSVVPKIELRDLNDDRKVIVVGGDHDATMGFIHGLKQYDYGGELTVILRDGELSYPYRKEELHRRIVNFRKDAQKSYYTPGELAKAMDERIYSHLQFHNEAWYRDFGVDFLFNENYFRLINKRFFPYLKARSGEKLEFDSILIAEGCLPKMPRMNGITHKMLVDGNADPKLSIEEMEKYDLPPNVFAPFLDKKEHLKMHQFLYENKVNTLLVMGMNVESLEFCEAFIKEFPTVKVKVVDFNKQNSLTEMLGPDIGDLIVKEYTKRGVEFYVKIQDEPVCSNKITTGERLFSESEEKKLEGHKEELNKICTQIKALEVQKDVKEAVREKQLSALRKKQEKVSEQIMSFKHKNLKEAISVEIGDGFVLKGEAMVLFPNNYVGKVDSVKFSKFTDIDYNKANNRIIVDPSLRSDTKRIFAAGSCCSMEFFFTRDRVSLLNANSAYEQGMSAAFNMSALNVPYAYIPFEKHQFFGKGILYAGVKRFYNQMYIIGSPKDWDFIAFYTDGEDIIATCASPSRQREFQVIREAFRLQCMPVMEDMIKQKWNIPKIYKLIRKLNKSGCYKGEIRKLSPEDDIANVVWMQRDKRSYTQNEGGAQGETNTELDSRGYVTEL